ncbi:hypothetical protein ACSDR0_45750 [Streptosporangium sp. G11]|uniref:hypothetical protein n=1 Tax=Streptosporangium sp. G11 TaxID=3436926 RepID=UPI003EBDF4E8
MGTNGAVHRFLVAHQVSQEETAARLRFHVAGAHAPHRAVRALPISVSATSARSRSRPPMAAMVRSIAEA